ncbi:hypothetical protein CFRA_02550 [Corynebacterium frankenforstense DSM 45800]|uniref:Uncharacterized protein n=1 Tax=Corynebacterium frankenforstense DSM 45800 TaxID=1437875 RepID=A0A1L7CR97_9CORY|nr:hypothetical protein [Corynebacterium frankenforstense]APT88339.1 hypothetical protein CFRA_02550 [Corynebacterium frankenforstense DSM 45800]
MNRRTSPGTSHATAQGPRCPADRGPAHGPNHHAIERAGTVGTRDHAPRAGRTALLTALAAVACVGLAACSGAPEGEGPALPEATGSLTTATPQAGPEDPSSTAQPSTGETTAEETTATETDTADAGDAGDAGEDPDAETTPAIADGPQNCGILQPVAEEGEWYQDQDPPVDLHVLGMTCADGRKLLTTYRTLPAGNYGNANIRSFDGWQCANRTAAWAQESGLHTACGHDDGRKVEVWAHNG